MVREIAVEIAPAAVPGRIGAHHRVALGRHGRAVHLHVVRAAERGRGLARIDRGLLAAARAQFPEIGDGEADRQEAAVDTRSEEHTSELQSRLHLVCRLLLEKKKKNNRKVRNLSQTTEIVST